MASHGRARHGLKQWYEAGVFTASLSDPTDPTRVHYYVGRQFEVDGRLYQVGIHEDVFDDVELMSLMRSSGLQPLRWDGPTPIEV